MKIKIVDNVLGIEDDGKFMPAKGVITHVIPDCDALITLAMFEYLKIYYGKLEFKSSGEGNLVNGKTAEAWLIDGWILSDIGGGESKRRELGIIHFDHHPSSFHPEQCAMTIALDFISSETEIPEEILKKLKKLARFVKDKDIHGKQSFLDLSHICKILSNKISPEDLYTFIKQSMAVLLDEEKGSNAELLTRIFREFSEGKKLSGPLIEYQQKLVAGKIPNVPNLLMITSEKTTTFVRYVLEEAYNDQILFIEAEKLFKEAEKISLYNDKFMVIAETDNNQFLKVALREGATLIVVKNSKGHVQIFTQKKDEINVANIAAAIRFEEAELSGNKDLINFETLRRDGTSEIAKNWHLFKQGGMLLNGSSTTPDQKPTALSLELIVDIVLKVIRNYMPSCNQGRDMCQKNCPIYPWGLDRCQRKCRQETSDRIELNGIKVRKGETLLLII